LYVLNYKITLLSKVLISSLSTDQNMVQTLDYLRGSTVLGMLASRFILKKRLNNCAHENDTFYRWFLRGDLLFSNGYIMGRHAGASPTPFYIQQQKTGHDLYNVFLDDTDEITKPLGGFSTINNNVIQNIKPKKRISFHHERERLTGTSQKGLFFNYESLLPGQTFVGSVYGSHQDLAAFKELMGQKFKAHLGKSKGTEYGDVEVEFLDIQKFDHHLSSHEDYLEEGIFLNFISPCILLNDLGFSDPSLANIEKYLEDMFGKDTFTIEGCIIKQEFIENYLSVWRMKRPLERAIAVGSTLYIYFEHINERILKGLRELLEKGMGERLGEGFGRLQVVSATTEEYRLDNTKEKLEKPDGPIPETMKQIFQEIIRDALLDIVKSKASTDANKFRNLPNNSLLGRLKLMADKADHSIFLSKVAQLREKAKNQLNNCYYVGSQGRESLFNYLKKQDEEKVLNNLFNNLGDYERLAMLTNFDIKEQKEYLQFLWNTYLQIFLKELWWMNKQQKEVEPS
jgi:CRISPR-associated protein Csx10